MTRDELFGYLAHDNVSACLRMLRFCEGTGQTDEAYRALFGWRPGNGKVFDSFEDHPRVRTYEKADEFIRNGKVDYTTAAGAYQITASTWDWIAPQFGLNDFGPTNQDLAAVALIRSRGALELVKEGRILEAIDRCKNVWASLPGSQWGQPTQKLEAALKVYRDHGGRVAGEAPTAPVVGAPAPSAPPKEVSRMSPIVVPILQSLASLIPALGKMFGSGSEVAERNVAAGTLIAKELVSVTQSVNLQEAAEKIQADPAALEAAKVAVSGVLLELGEAGGGGIKGARDAAFANSGDWRRLVFSFPFVVFLAIMPPIWLVVFASVVKVEWLAAFTDDQRIMVLAAVINLGLGSLIGFAFGTSISTQKKDAVLGRPQ